jgi:fructose-bisphosphate aldolase class II
MPVADYTQYCEMLDRARKGRFAYPAINVTSLTTANAVLKGLADSRSDGIIQVSTGGGAFASGTGVKDMALGAMSIAEHVTARRRGIQLRGAPHGPLPGGQGGHVRDAAHRGDRGGGRRGKPNLLTAMFDAGARRRSQEPDIAVGCLNGAEDVISRSKSKSSAERRTAEGERRREASRRPEPLEGTAVEGGAGRALPALAIPGNVRCMPGRQTETVHPEGLPGCRRRDVGAARFYLVFPADRSNRDIHEALDRRGEDGRHRRAVRVCARHRRILFRLRGVLRVDGEVGNKKAYDPRSYMTLAESAMAARVVRATTELRSAGTTMRH